MSLRSARSRILLGPARAADGLALVDVDVDVAKVRVVLVHVVEDDPHHDEVAARELPRGHERVTLGDLPADDVVPRLEVPFGRQPLVVLRAGFSMPPWPVK